LPIIPTTRIVDYKVGASKSPGPADGQAILTLIDEGEQHHTFSMLPGLAKLLAKDVSEKFGLPPEN